MRVDSLPTGSRGIDCNTVLSLSSARAFAAKGFQFAVRYVRRSQPHDFDITMHERDTILSVGMGLMIVQHVAPPGWVPTSELGTSYGAVAVMECAKAGIPSGVSTWLDLEGVRPGLDHEQTIQFCNNWYDQVRGAGLQPGLYVGDAPGLTAKELYARLKFRNYWGAYNLNSDEIPMVRGLQMRQHVAKEADFVPGFNSQNLDTDTIFVDALGNTPSVLVP